MGKHSFYDADTGEKVFGRASRMPAMVYGPPPTPVYSDEFYVRKAVKNVWNRTFEKYGSSPRTGIRAGVKFSEPPNVPLDVENGEIVPAWYWKDQVGYASLSELIHKAKKLYENVQKRERINAFRENKVCIQVSGSALLWGVGVSGDIYLFDLISCREVKLNRDEYNLNIESYSRLNGTTFSRWHCQNPDRYPVDYPSLKAIFEGIEAWMAEDQPANFVLD